jgi:hypothetical protein
MEVSNTEPNTIAIFCFDCMEGNWMIVSLAIDEIEILSRGYNE